MKRTARIFLAVVLAVALALPAAAAAPTDQRLTQVTQAVKERLNIGDSYTTFYGEFTEEGMRTCWTLHWEKEGETLRVVAGEDGTIYRYDRSREDDTGRGDSQSAFPALSRAEALPYAQAFVDQVLSAPASARLTAEGESDRVGQERYSFQTQLLYYGLTSPVGLWLEVDARDGAVLSYQRDDLYQTYLNQPADPAPYVGAEAQAAALLKGTLELKLEYVLDENDPDKAVLRYVPVQGDDYYVDAATGALVNLSQLYRELEEDKGTNGTPGAGQESGSASDSLTDAEQEGIAQMAGVWSKEDLDRQAHTFGALKLEGWTLSSCDYRLDRESGDVTATLRYTRDQEGSTSRTVTLDGKTGALLGAGGYAWTEEDYQPAVSQQDAQKTAEDFVAGLWGEQWNTCALYDSTLAEGGNRVYTFTFAQQVNGYFFPDNAITVGVDSADGTVLRLYRSFGHAPVFDDPAGVISMEAALDAWFNTYTVQLGYVAVPRQLDRYGDQYQDLIARGYSYWMALELGCALERERSLLGIDAKTGQPVEPLPGVPDRPTYSDLEGSWGKTQAEALAAYGVGWLGGKLEGDKALTQLDLMALMVSADGYLADLSQEGAADQVYDRAVSMGLLKRSQRQDDQPVTRAELVKVLLDWGGYGNAAVIPGIFQCSFTDQSDIPTGYYGYAAIAQGLNVVQGDGEGRFWPNRTATRLEAVVMLYQLMAR